MNTYTENTIYEIRVDADKHVRRREILQTYRNDELFSSEVVSNRLIKPDDNIAEESPEVRRELSTIFVPTVINRAVAKTEYDEAKEGRNPAAIEKAEAALKAAEAAHKAFIDAEE